MIEMTRAMRHLSWADDRFFAALADLPDEAFAVSYAPDAWSVGRLTTHIVGAAEWYCYCTAGIPWTDLRPAASGADVRVLQAHLAELDAVLLEQASLADDRMSFEDEGGPSSAMRSTLLTQAVVHATEHRAQICCALAANGFDTPSLDDLDLWAFERWERSAG